MRRLLFFLLLALTGCGARAPAPGPVAVTPHIRLDTAADKRAAFARAYRSLRTGDDAQALPLFLALAGQYPELADYALFYAGELAAKGGDDGTASNAFARLLRDYPQCTRAAAAALQYGKLLVRGDRLDAARPLLERARLAPDKATAEGARLALAEIDERSGDWQTAAAGYSEARRNMVGTATGRGAKQRLLALRAAHPELVPAGADLLDEAHLLLQEHDYSAAQQAAQRLLDERVVDPGNAARIDADALYGRGNIEAALARLRRLVDAYPQSPAAPDALFRYASVLWNRDRDAEALSAYQEFRRRYAGDPHAADALYGMGRIYEGAGRSDLALSAFTTIVRDYPRSSVADEARWRIGWNHLRAHEWLSAADAFAQFARETASPRLRNEATYWQARALERAGRTEAAHALYRDLVDRDPADYYAMWAERRLGLPTALLPTYGEVAAVRIAVSDPGDAVALQPRTDGDAFHIGRWNELRAAGVNALAREELAAIEREHGDDVVTLRALLGAYQTVDGFAAAQRLLRRLGDSAGLSDGERQRLLYPLAFWQLVSRDARDSSVDPLLVEAVMRQESLFDPEAKSSASAYGLMQLVPETATRVAAGSGRVVDPVALFEPDLNIDLGTRYLNGLLARFDGDVLKAVAAYNGGEAAVDKWQQRFSDLDEDEFVESITYRETRDYVKRVVSNYRMYRLLYAAPQG